MSDETRSHETVLGGARERAGPRPATGLASFDPYFTTKALGSGTGPGLSTILGMVKGARGSIRVDSNLGRGAAFMIHLPRTAAPLEPPSTDETRAGRGQGLETILLVDDEADIRDLAREFLVMNGYHVLEAADGVEALRVAAEHRGRIDVMVTDVRMPRMDGHELAKRLLALRPEVKVIYTSGYSALGPDEPTPGHSAPFLPKPYSLDRLRRTIRAEVDGPTTG
jgi:CheY-like chemotaxis protein